MTDDELKAFLAAADAKGMEKAIEDEIARRVQMILLTGSSNTELAPVGSPPLNMMDECMQALTPLKPNEYRCANCHNVYEKTWTDEESMAECRELFGDFTPDECVVVCDDCFQAHHPEKFPHEVERAVADQIRAREKR